MILVSIYINKFVLFIELLMQKIFKLDTQLEKDTFEIMNLELSKLLLMNNKNFIWLILVPEVYNAREIIDLSSENQQILMNEISKISKALKALYNPYKINIASLGNIVEQLHIHIVARNKNDHMWPKPVFGSEVSLYSIDESNKIIKNLRKYFHA